MENPQKGELFVKRENINGCYPNLLRYAPDINWKDHIRNKDVFQDLPSATTKIKGKHGQ